MTAAYVTYEDLAKMKKEVLQASAPASILREVDASTKFRRMLSSDLAIGRALTGPQFIDTVAIKDGAVTADKLVANLVLSTTIIAGAESPADRIEFTAAGIKAYGTVGATPNTETLSIDNDGSFTFGVSPDQIEFVASTGTLTIPAAVITSLTIAAVGSGVIGGNYDTSANTAKLRLSTSGLEAWNSSGAKTVNIDATNGNFTLSNDPAGANRISMSQAGIELWKSSNRAFYLQAGGATNSIEMLLTGPGAGEYIGMNPTDGFWLGASTYAGASTKFRVSPAGALQATSATISGAITATSGELQTLSVTGGLTISSAGVFRSGPTSGSRTEMDSTGFYQYGASGTGTPRARLLATGAGALGISTTYSSGVIQWDTAGALTLAGFTVTSTTISSGTGGSYVTMSSGSTAFSAGGATPGSAPFNVSNAGVLSAASAVISGAVTASSLTITGTASFSGGTMTLPNGGSITSSAVNINGNSSGNGNIDNMNVANLTIDGTLTLSGASAKIIDQDGSYWDQSGLVLKTAGGYGDAIKWITGTSTNQGSIYSVGSGLVFRGGANAANDGILQLYSSGINMAVASGANSVSIDMSPGTSDYLTIASSAGNILLQDSAGSLTLGAGTSDNLYLDAAYPWITGSSASNNPILRFTSAYSVGSTTAWSTNGPGTANITSVSTTYLLINIAGILYRIPIWANS